MILFFKWHSSFQVCSVSFKIIYNIIYTIIIFLIFWDIIWRCSQSLIAGRDPFSLDNFSKSSEQETNTKIIFSRTACINRFKEQIWKGRNDGKEISHHYQVIVIVFKLTNKIKCLFVKQERSVFLLSATFPLSFTSQMIRDKTVSEVVLLDLKENSGSQADVLPRSSSGLGICSKLLTNEVVALDLLSTLPPLSHPSSPRSCPPPCCYVGM